MDEAIRKLKSTTFLGRRLTRRQIADVQRTARSFPGLSCNELAHTVESPPPLIFPAVYRLSKPTWRRPFTLAVSA